MDVSVNSSSEIGGIATWETAHTCNDDDHDIGGTRHESPTRVDASIHCSGAMDELEDSSVTGRNSAATFAWRDDMINLG